MTARHRTVLLEAAQRGEITEARAGLAATSAGETGRYVVQLIDSGWGSSGYYSPDVLAEAATRRVFPEGLHMYADHPRGDGSGLDAHGNRSVHDLWAVLASDARVDDSGALIAEAQVFAPYRELVGEMASSIGLSIRAVGAYELGEAEGRSGQLITSIDEAMSVDFVVAAGRGGRILQVVESARAHATAVAESLPGDLTGNTLRAALQDVIADTYAAETDRWAYVEDFTDTLVFFRTSGENVPCRLWQQGFTFAAGATEPALSGAPVEVRAETHYVPVDPVGLSTTTAESQEDTMPQIEEARLRQLEADAGRVQTLESERDAAAQRAEQAERQLAESTARTAARPVVAAVLAEGARPLPASTIARLTESLVATAPRDAAGQLDEAALRTATAAARTQAEAELAEALEAAGVGRPRGAGQSQTGLTEADDVAREIARRNAGVEA